MGNMELLRGARKILVLLSQHWLWRGRLDGGVRLLWGRLNIDLTGHRPGFKSEFASHAFLQEMTRFRDKWLETFSDS